MRDALGATSGTTTVSLTVNPVNDAPIALADTFTVTAGGTLTGANVLTNDTDVEDTRPQTAVLVTGPATAQTFTLNPDGTFTYVPNAGVTTDSFTYFARDAAGLASNTVTVTLSVSSTPNQSPTGIADGFTLDEDTTFNTGNVLTNDSDPDNNLPLTAQITGNPTNAQSFTLNTDGTFTYIPTANFNGIDSFTYVVRDSLGGTSSTTTVSLTVNPVNDAPTALPNSFVVNEDGVLSNNVLTNVTDPEGNTPLTAQIVSNPTNFQGFTLSSDGSFTYVPTPNFNGSDSFTYFVRDSLGAGSNTATVSLIISPVNDAPVANADTYRAVIDTPLTVTAPFGVIANDTDLENEPRSAIAGVRTTTGGGTVTLNADGSFVYNPATGFSGADTFTYQATDSTALSNTATVTLTVGTNAAPIATPDTDYRALPAVATTFNSFQGVLRNDTDPDGDIITAIAGARTSANGATVTLNADGSFTYRPPAGFIGPDSFTYQVTDGFVTSTPGTVSITVSNNAPPIANSDTGYRALAGRTLTVDVLGNVLANDEDPDGGTLTAVAGVRNTAGNGTVTLNADGTFIYTPQVAFLGTDTFIYQATDGTDTSNLATVSISVVINSAPTARNDLYAVPPNNPFTVGAVFGVLSNDTDFENNPLTVVAGARPTTAGGTVSLNADGSFVYRPVNGFTGTDTFTYVANDGTSSSTPATVTLSVFVNNAPIAGNDSFSTNIDRSLSVGGPGVLANDSDPDGNNIQAFVVTTTANGTLQLLPNGSFTYTPRSGFSGNDTFSYRVNDGFADAFATATISVSPNVAPVANTDSYSVNRNNVLVVPYTAGTTTIAGVLSNDVDTDPLTASIVTNPGQGNVLLNPDGTFTYTPFSNIGGLNDTFVYRASDGNLSSTATVTITIRNSSTPPIATGETFSVQANNTLSVGSAQSLLLNDTDPDGDRLTVRVTQNPTGSVSLNPDGTFTYAPTANFTGIDTFTYVANDGVVDSNPVTVSITVGAVNSPPTVNLPGSQVGFRNADLIIPSGLSISDPDAGSNPVRLSMTVTNGSLNLSSTNGLTILDAPGDSSVAVEGSLASINAALTNLVYSPNLNYAGPDQLAISVSDLGNTGATGGVQTATGTVSINISSGAAQVADINQTSTPGQTNTLSSSPTNLVAVGNTVYFAADDGVEGVELWQSDGTDAGTTLVANINPAVGGSSSPSNLTVVGNNLFFTANNGTSGVELFKTDLTTGVTSLVKNIRALTASSNPTNLVNFNGTLFFRANDGTGLALWKSDGTDAGTVKVGTGYSLPSSLTVVGSTLYFTANNGTELWKTDGTNAGTVRVKQLGASNAASLTAVGNTLFFTATDASNGNELWRSDGTDAGTIRVSDINTGTGSATPNNLVSLNNTLYFFASNGTTVGLYRSTAAGVVSLVQVLPANGQLPASLTVVGTNLFFTVDSGTPTSPDVQLWKSDGTSAGTALVRDIDPLGNDEIASLTNVGGSLFFTANDGFTRIWVTDGTSAGTVPVSGSFTAGIPTNLTPVGTQLFFTAETPTTGTELWVL